MAAAWDEPQPPARRWPLVTGLVVAVLVAGLVARGGLGEPADEALPVTRETEPPEPAEPTPTPAASPRPAGGVWLEVGMVPGDPPGTHTGVWTGRELVLGVGTAVVAYEPSTGVWRELPAMPGPRRVGPEVVWSGEEIFVFGGSDGPGPHRRNGLRLDPDAGAWRPVPPLPGAPLWEPTAVWTGEELVVWGGVHLGWERDGATEPGLWPARGWAFDPETERWRALPDGPVRGVFSTAGRWTGRELVVWGTHLPPGTEVPGGGGNTFAAAYDPAADTWRELPPPPLVDPAAAGAVWTGTALVLWGQSPWWPLEDAPAMGVVLELTGGEQSAWRELPPLQLGDPPPSVHGLVTGWTGETAIFMGGTPRSVAVAYDPAEHRWEQLPVPRARVNAVGAWTGSELLVWGGYTATGADNTLWAYCPPEATSATCAPATLVPRESRRMP